jgi:tRNA pseudouridine55 synthase
MADRLSGWLVIDKPAGMNSTHVVSRVKRLLQLPKGYKIGHGGTLDPFADGVLPLGIGEATKALGYILDATKTYQFTLTWGVQTDTDDNTGQVIATSDKRPTQAEIEAMLPQFTGKITQIPPAYSALKFAGQRAYDLVRAGKAPDMAEKTREVTIYSLNLDEVRPDGAILTAKVSKGTYIRSLGRDIALALGAKGHLSTLRRIQAGPFHLGQAITLEMLDSGLKKGQSAATFLMDVTVALDDIPVYRATDAEVAALKNGIVPANPGLIAGVWQVRNPQDQLQTMVQVQDNGTWQILRNFNNDIEMKD